MKNILLFLTLLILSCQSSEQENTSYRTVISGTYMVSKISSNVKVDMNNDGVKTNDMLDEISYYNINGSKVLMVNFKSNFHAEIRPLNYQNSSAKILDFGFPHQYLFQEKNSINEYVLMDNLKSFVGYEYELKGDKILLNSYIGDYNNQFGEIISCEKRENNSVVLSIKKWIFDFKDQEWKIIPMEITYQKI